MTDLDRTLDFLNGIGFSLTAEHGVNGFLDGGGVLIRDGALVYDPDRALVSDLLHEAAHIAIMPPRWRPLLQRDVDGAIEIMFNEMAPIDLHPDHPLSRAAMQCSDPEATSWAWAAGHAIGLAPEVVILDWQYEGEGSTERLRLLPSLSAVRRVTGHMGIHGLAYAGFCSLREGGVLPMYPRMRIWMQDADI